MVTFSARDLERLRGVHPQLSTRLLLAWAEVPAMFIVMGIRTAAQQAVYYAQGRTTPGKIVTNCDGVRHPSPHQVRADGYGHAVDCAFISGDPFSAKHPWEAFGDALERHGLIWGGRFHHPIDLDHAEL